MSNSCHHSNTSMDRLDKPHAVVLVGNMNVGKSTLFSRLCPAEVASFTFPGTTVAIKRGAIKNSSRTAYLTPGIYSIFSANEDETASRDILLHHELTGTIDGIVLVADAKNLSRSIAIGLQYGEYGLPMLLVVNMTDEAASRGIEIDYKKLSAKLGIEVVAAVARESIGIGGIITGLNKMRPLQTSARYPDWVADFLHLTEELLNPSPIYARALGLLVLAEDRGALRFIRDTYGREKCKQLQENANLHRRNTPEEFIISLGNTYNKAAELIVKNIQQVSPPAKDSFTETFGHWCAQLSTGIPIALAILFLMYQFIGSFGATYLADTINVKIFEGVLIPIISRVIEPLSVAFIKDMIIDPDFGILPTGVFLALGLVLPVLFCFYVAFGLLEDSGYLPRLSILLDKVFMKMGLNGKGVIPLVMGFSCVTMAILTTRLLGTKKEKNIATFLLLLGMPCAPLIAVMLIILEPMPFIATLTVFGIIFGQVFIAGMILNKLLPGTRSPFIMVIPPMRIPKPLLVIRRSAAKTYYFMKEAVPIFILASFIVFVFQRLGGLQAMEHMLRPVTTGLMGLPEKSVQVFIKTLIRRENGATELEHLRTIYTNRQLVVNLLVMTFLTPCLNAIIVLIKERGLKTAGMLILSVLTYAVVFGTIFNYSCRALGITFA
jgi:ferrous iron transport protein B